MNAIRHAAKDAKKRLKSGFWQQCLKELQQKQTAAMQAGINPIAVQSEHLKNVKKMIRGEKEDEFYIKVKTMLDTYGEVSDAIGRLTDMDYFATLSYSERQRYTLELSSRYVKALERYRKEKDLTV